MNLHQLQASGCARTVADHHEVQSLSKAAQPATRALKMCLSDEGHSAACSWCGDRHVQLPAGLVSALIEIESWNESVEIENWKLEVACSSDWHGPYIDTTMTSWQTHLSASKLSFKTSSAPLLAKLGKYTSTWELMISAWSKVVEKLTDKMNAEQKICRKCLIMILALTNSATRVEKIGARWTPKLQNITMTSGPVMIIRFTSSWKAFLPQEAMTVILHVKKCARLQTVQKLSNPKTKMGLL